MNLAALRLDLGCGDTSSLTTSLEEGGRLLNAYATAMRDSYLLTSVSRRDIKGEVLV